MASKILPNFFSVSANSLMMLNILYASRSNFSGVIRLSKPMMRLVRISSVSKSWSIFTLNAWRDSRSLNFSRSRFDRTLLPRTKLSAAAADTPPPSCSSASSSPPPSSPSAPPRACNTRNCSKMLFISCRRCERRMEIISISSKFSSSTMRSSKSVLLPAICCSRYVHKSSTLRQRGCAKRCCCPEIGSRASTSLLWPPPPLLLVLPPLSCSCSVPLLCV
mmetsp:Transcript_20269/g.32416  ORF Transcript_20269/g.32416 Transcript_20269/m.32416 type:complete len:220 (+) Transcript_20269:463-1122(+)